MRTTQVRRRLHFALALCVLATSAALMQDAKNRGWLRVIKKALPIRKPLRDMDRRALLPFQFVVSQQKLAAETEAELGTNEYINWFLDRPDLAQRRRAWRGRVVFSVSYYTGKQDQVPHVPEECFYQGAFSPAGDDTLDMEMGLLGRTVPVRRLAFYPPRRVGTKSFVYYVICVNNDFFPERNRARVRMANNRDSHLFYSKVEVLFEGIDERRQSQVDDCARELLDKALTELVRSHWPPKGWERGGPPASPGESGDTGGDTEAP